MISENKMINFDTFTKRVTPLSLTKSFVTVSVARFLRS